MLLHYKQRETDKHVAEILGVSRDTMKNGDNENGSTDVLYMVLPWYTNGNVLNYIDKLSSDKPSQDLVLDVNRWVSALLPKSLHF